MLTGKQKRFLRSMANELNPIIQIGKDGITDSLVKELDEALEAHELIKVKILPNSFEDKDQAGEEIARATRSEVAQVIGSIILLYRRASKKPVIELPE